MKVNKIKHLTLIKLIIFLGKIIEINFLRNIFKIILDKKKFTTVADIFLDKFIRFGIFLLYPGKGVLSEESRKNKNISWIIDPLDGTMSFVNGFKGYVIQACRIESGIVEESIIYAPASNECFSYLSGDLPRKNLKVIEKLKDNDERLAIIDNYPQPRGIAKFLLENIQNSIYIESGSLSMKSLLVCLGLADIFVKDIPVRDWDVAPIIPFLGLRDCIMQDINGNSFTINPLSFEKKGLLVTPAIYSKQLLPLIKSYLDVNVIKYKKF